MTIIYSGQHKPIIGKSVFLAGCSPRKGQTLEWRKEAIKWFDDFGFDGTLCVPEPEDGEPWADYLSVVEWEREYLEKCDLILFWVPRNIETGILGLTTNAEFGYWMAKNPDKVFYGRPEGSDNNRYLDWMYEKYTNDPPTPLISNLVQNCLNFLSDHDH